MTAVPIWNGCVSGVFDFVETVQLITLQDDRVVSRRDLSLSGAGDWDRINRLIESKPNVLLWEPYHGVFAVVIKVDCRAFATDGDGVY